MRQEIQDVFKKHGVQLFTFTQEDLFTYILKTPSKIDDSLIQDLKSVFPAVCEIKVEEWNMPLRDKENKKSNSFSESFKNIFGVKNPNETVDHPSHYNTGSIEVIDAIEDWELGFNLGNAVKYIARAGKKDPTKECEDLKKAAWYLQRAISAVDEPIQIEISQRVKEKPESDSMFDEILGRICENCKLSWGYHIGVQCPKTSTIFLYKGETE